jgi:hypothetical protein
LVRKLCVKVRQLGSDRSWKKNHGWAGKPAKMLARAGKKAVPDDGQGGCVDIYVLLVCARAGANTARAQGDWVYEYDRLDGREHPILGAAKRVALKSGFKLGELIAASLDESGPELRFIFHAS